MTAGRRDVTSSGAAITTTLASELTQAATSIALTAATGWPSGGTYPFEVIVDPDGDNEEHILCQSRSGTTCAVASSGRGYDSTADITHPPGTPVRVGLTAEYLGTLNLHLFDTTRDEHTQYLTVARHAATVHDASMLGVDSVGSSELADNAVDTAAIANNAVTNNKMADNSVDSAEIVAGAVDLAHMSADSVDSNQYVDGSIDRVHLSADIIDGTKIEDNAVGTEHIAPNAITTSEMAANSVDSEEIQTAAVDPVHHALGTRPTFQATSAPGSPVEGDLWFDTDDNVLCLYNGAEWVTITPVSAVVATAEERDSATFGDCATPGPAVSVLTGAKALVTVGAHVTGTVSSDFAAMSFTVSGATTLAASGGRSVYWGDVTTEEHEQSRTVYLAALTPGVNTFTAKYAVTAAGNDSWSARTITVVGIP